jgi:hypothetical protein
MLTNILQAAANYGQRLQHRHCDHSQGTPPLAQRELRRPRYLIPIAGEPRFSSLYKWSKCVGSDLAARNQIRRRLNMDCCDGRENLRGNMTL